MDRTKVTWTENGRKFSRVYTFNSPQEYNNILDIVKKRKDKGSRVTLNSVK